jgi:polyhydroxybutyrate depolymerase
MNFSFRRIALAGLASGCSLWSCSASDLALRTWTVGGETREALVQVPAMIAPAGAPVVFAFHGHGGTMQHAARTFGIHQLWPEAIVVYPQGLPTPGQITDPDGRRAGWQPQRGALGDRDLKFFDAVLASLRAGSRIDEKRIYAMGHSNGGAFTYLLWAERSEVLAACAPSAAVLGRGAGGLKPKPVLHVASPDDPLVKFAWQERMIDHVLQLNGCGARKVDASGHVSYPSSAGADVATFIHPGGHRYPEEASALIVSFFQAHVRR